MRKLAIVSGAMLLAACGSSESGTIETDDGTVEYEADTSGDGVEMSFTDDEGNETTLTSGSNVEVDLPDGFSIYPGAEIVQNTVVDGADGQGSMIIMTSSDTPQEMVNHFRSQAEAAGIDIQMEMTSGDTRIIGGEGPDDRFFSFTASGEGDETTGMLTIGTRPQ